MHVDRDKTLFPRHIITPHARWSHISTCCPVFSLTQRMKPHLLQTAGCTISAQIIINPLAVTNGSRNCNQRAFSRPVTSCKRAPQRPTTCAISPATTAVVAWTPHMHLLRALHAPPRVTAHFFRTLDVQLALAKRSCPLAPPTSGHFAGSAGTQFKTRPTQGTCGVGTEPHLRL